jgi:uncharacterized protein (TIGR00369 family)
MKKLSPPPRRSDAEQARLDAALIAHFHPIAFSHQAIGLIVECVRLPQPRLRVNMKPLLIGTPAYQRLHGGAIATALDDVGGLSMMVSMGEKFCDETLEQLEHRFVRSATLDLRVEYLRPGLGEYFIASAEVTRFGARVGSVQSRLVNDHGVLIATGASTYIVS